MIKKSQIKILIIFIISVILHLSTQAQTRKYFIINGIIISESNDYNSSSVQIIKNNQKTVTSQIPEHGRFRLELDYSAEYQLIFNQKGSQSKTIIINTDIPEDKLSSSTNFPHFLMAVKFSVADQDPEKINPGNQVQHISYFSQKDSFLRVPTVPGVEYVERGKSNQRIQAQDNKAKLQEYQVF